MAIPMGGEPLLQATLALGGRPERSLGSPPAGTTELESFALLMAGQAASPSAEAGTAEAPPAPKARNAPMPPGLQGQALPWEALAAAAEEAGQLMALLQSAALAQPSAPPPAELSPLPDAGPLVPDLAAAGPAALTPEAVAALAGVAGPPGMAPAPNPALAPALAVPQPVSDETARPPANAPDVTLPPVLAGAASPISGPGPMPIGPVPPQTPGLARDAAPARSQAPMPPPGPDLAPPPAPPLDGSLPQSGPPTPATAAAAMAGVLAETVPPEAVPALSGDPAAARGLPRATIRSAHAPAEALATLPGGEAPPDLPHGLPVAQALPGSAEAPLAVPPSGPRPDKARAPLPGDEADAARLTVPGAASLPAASEIAVRPDPASLPAEATLLRWTPVVQEASAPAAPLQGQAMAHPRVLAEAAPQLVLRVKEATEQGVETVSVDLRPPELGRVELRLTFREGTVQVVMLAERAETFEALRQERHSLMQQMEQAGLQLGGQGLDFQHGSLRWAEREAPEPGRTARAEAGAGEEEQAAGVSAAPRRPASDSLIDIVA